MFKPTGVCHLRNTKAAIDDFQSKHLKASNFASNCHLFGAISNESNGRPFVCASKPSPSAMPIKEPKRSPPLVLQRSRNCRKGSSSWKVTRPMTAGFSWVPNKPFIPEHQSRLFFHEGSLATRALVQSGARWNVTKRSKAPTGLMVLWVPCELLHILQQR